MIYVVLAHDKIVLKHKPIMPTCKPADELTRVEKVEKRFDLGGNFDRQQRFIQTCDDEAVPLVLLLEPLKYKTLGATDCLHDVRTV